MAKIYFRYGMMNASKSIQVLTVAHNYEEQGKKVLLLVPRMANRDGEGVIASRVGISKPATIIDEDTNIVKIALDEKPDCIIIDEAQFLSQQHVGQLASIADNMNTPVIAYGLLKDYKAGFFTGSASLVLIADSIEEIKTICAHPECHKKAIMILKYKDGKPVYSGEQVEIGGNDVYKSVCRYHYMNPQGVIA